MSNTNSRFIAGLLLLYLREGAMKGDFQQNGLSRAISSTTWTNDVEKEMIAAVAAFWPHGTATKSGNSTLNTVISGYAIALHGAGLAANEAQGVRLFNEMLLNLIIAYRGRPACRVEASVLAAALELTVERKTTGCFGKLSEKTPKTIAVPVIATLARELCALAETL